MRFDNLVGEQTTREALWTRREIERRMRLLLRGWCERDQILFQDLGSNAGKDLLCPRSIRHKIEERQDRAQLVGICFIHSIKFAPAVFGCWCQPGMLNMVFMQQSSDSGSGI